MPLVPCPSCRRHLRAQEERCPFCEAPVRRRVAGVAAAGLAGALALTGCPQQPAQQPAQQPTPPADSTPVPAYGGPALNGPPPAPVDTSQPAPPAVPMEPDPGDDERPAARYGAPPRQPPSWAQPPQPPTDAPR